MRSSRRMKMKRKKCIGFPLSLQLLPIQHVYFFPLTVFQGSSISGVWSWQDIAVLYESRHPFLSPVQMGSNVLDSPQFKKIFSLNNILAMHGNGRKKLSIPSTIDSGVLLWQSYTLPDRFMSPRFAYNSICPKEFTAVKLDKFNKEKDLRNTIDNELKFSSPAQAKVVKCKTILGFIPIAP